MATDLIRYDLLVQEALRGVVRRVLTDVSRHGLPGDQHHLYISFRTQQPGVRLSNRLREQYPDEMTIVLQHQFWDLKAGETGFEVTLSFKGVSEHLAIPYEAIVGFYDPSVQFGLKFEAEEKAAEPQSQPPGKAPTEPSAATKKPEAAPEPVVEAAPMADGPKVVSLDAFRKKP